MTLHLRGRHICHARNALTFHRIQIDQIGCSILSAHSIVDLELIGAYRTYNKLLLSSCFEKENKQRQMNMMEECSLQGSVDPQTKGMSSFRLLTSRLCFWLMEAGTLTFSELG